MKRNGKMMRKRIVLILCCLGLILGLAACGGEKVLENSGSGGSGQASGTQSQSSQSGGQSGSQSGSQSGGQSQGSPTQSTALKGYTFKAETSAGSLMIGADQNMAEILAVLGEADSYFEAASCAFEGLDKMYTYKHFEIDTYPQGEVDLVSAIYLLDDLVATPEGLRIGSSKEQVESLYGTPTSQVGAEYIYDKEGMSLRIQLENDKVTVILYASSAMGQVAQ